MAEEKTNGNTPDLSNILGDLLSNKDFMTKISEISGRSDDQETPSESSQDTSGISGLLSNPDIISKLPEVISVMKPLITASGSESSHHKTTDKRLDLLMAMKPFLSSKRCEAIDYIARMSKIAETVKGLKL